MQDQQASSSATSLGGLLVAHWRSDLKPAQSRPAPFTGRDGHLDRAVSLAQSPVPHVNATLAGVPGVLSRCALVWGSGTALHFDKVLRLSSAQRARSTSNTGQLRAKLTGRFSKSRPPLC